MIDPKVKSAIPAALEAFRDMIISTQLQLPMNFMKFLHPMQTL
jgi:hypothetical protein